MQPRSRTRELDTHIHERTPAVNPRGVFGSVGETAVVRDSRTLPRFTRAIFTVIFFIARCRVCVREIIAGFTDTLIVALKQEKKKKEERKTRS